MQIRQPTPDLQRATPDMAPAASELIYLTMGGVADYLFGADNPERARAVLGRLFQAGSNRFSYRYTDVAALAGQVAGLLISYSGRVMRSLEMPTAFEMMRAVGVRDFIGFKRRAVPLAGLGEAENDEYFISNVAVLPEHQGKGLGSCLLRHAEASARMQGFRTLSLTVEADNQRARSLYERFGFGVVQTVEIEVLRRRFGYAGFHRMVKILR